MWQRRPSASNNDEQIDKIRDFVRSDHQLTVRMVGEQLRLPHITIRQIVTDDLVMRKRGNGSCVWGKHQDHLGAALCHTEIFINQFLATKNISVSPRPPSIHPTWVFVTFPNSTFENWPQKTSFRDTTEYWNGHDRPTECYSSIRVPKLLWNNGITADEIIFEIIWNSHMNSLQILFF